MLKNIGVRDAQVEEVYSLDEDSLDTIKYRAQPCELLSMILMGTDLSMVSFSYSDGNQRLIQRKQRSAAQRVYGLQIRCVPSLIVDLRLYQLTIFPQ